MQEMIKIVLSPTRLVRIRAPEAIGSILFDDTGKRASIHLFNLPKPDIFLPEPNPSAAYTGWFYHPASGEVLPIGTLLPAGEQLYILYDVPFAAKAGFHEVIITVETADGPAPQGEILLIGYLGQETGRMMESFEPFDPPLPHHRWWKIHQGAAHSPKHIRTDPTPSGEHGKASHPVTGPAARTARFDLPCARCPQRQPQPPGRLQAGFYLPHIIGMVTDEGGILQYIVHGIPGRLLRAEQPGEGQTGYLHWQPYYGMEERIGAIGYWLCYINPGTNQVLTPQGVTIPPG